MRCNLRMDRLTFIPASIRRTTGLSVAGPICLLLSCTGAERTVQPDRTNPSTTVSRTSEDLPGPIEVVDQRSPEGTLVTRREGFRTADGTFVMHGASTKYFENGRPKLEHHYAYDVLHGDRISWYDSGQVAGKGAYKKGREDGPWTAWWANGFKQREFHLKNGAFHGLWTEWHRNGEKKMEFEYVYGRKQGSFTIWDEQGNVAYQSEYVDDVEQP